MRNMTIATNENGQKVNLTTNENSVINVMKEIKNGQMVSAKDYISTTGRIEPETSDITVIHGFFAPIFNKKKLAQLQNINFEKIAEDAQHIDKLKSLSKSDLHDKFLTRLEFMKSSTQKTLDKVADSSQRVAHKRNYIFFKNGLKVNLVTEKVNGIQTPILADNGLPTAASVLLHGLVISKTVTKKGKYKAVNSGIPVLIGQLISKQLSVGVKMITLSVAKCKKLVANKNVIILDDAIKDFIN